MREGLITSSIFRVFYIVKAVFKIRLTELNGKLNITLLSISELAKALEVEPKDLLTFEIEA